MQRILSCTSTPFIAKIFIMHSVTSSTVTDLQAKVKYLEELDKGQKEEVSSSYMCMHQIVLDSYSDALFV
jgi:hypothetical protein